MKGVIRMTGKDLIVYILSNDLINDPILNNGRFLNFLNVEEVANKLNVGPATVRAMFELGILPGVKIGEIIYIHKDYEDSSVTNYTLNSKREDLMDKSR